MCISEFFRNFATENKTISMKRLLLLCAMLYLPLWAMAQDVLPRKAVQDTLRANVHSYSLSDSIAVSMSDKGDSIANTDGDMDEDFDVKPLRIKDIRHRINFGHNNKREGTSIIVIHSNYYAGSNPFSTEGCISQFRQYHVAPHYMIERNGTILKMVDESDMAFHAGPSRLPGTHITSLNRYSIGIEIINSREEGPTKAQYASLIALVRDIQRRHHIRHIVRHSDIAPGRKDDPWKFDWEWFIHRISPLP